MPQDVLNGVRSKLEEIKMALEPYLNKLSPDERRDLETKEADSLEFMALAHELAVEYSELLPGLIGEPLYRKEFSVIYNLNYIKNRLNYLIGEIEDTELTIGNNVLDTARVFYNTVRIAARRDEPGVRVIYDEFRARIPSRKYRRKKAG